MFEIYERERETVVVGVITLLPALALATVVMKKTEDRKDRVFVDVDDEANCTVQGAER